MSDDFLPREEENASAPPGTRRPSWTSPASSQGPPRRASAEVWIVSNNGTSKGVGQRGRVSTD